MRFRFTFLFLLLVGVPLAMMAWIGVMLLRGQQTRAKESWLTVINTKLKAADSLIAQEMTRLESDLNALLQDVKLDDLTLHDLPREQPMVRHAFLLDPRGRLLFPKPADTVQGEGAAFLRRTESIWESGVKFGVAAQGAAKESVEPSQPLAQQAQQNTSNSLRASTYGQTQVAGVDQQATYNMKSDVRPAVKGQSKNPSSGTPPAMLSVAGGWHVWFYGSGPHMLFWQERGDASVLGVEIEMEALLSLILNRLSSEDAPQARGLMQLASADGKSVLHQWGAAAEDEVLAPVAQQMCAAPLGMWRLAYRPAKGEQPRAQRGPVFLGLGSAGLALLAVALLFLRESTRDMREARRRVSFVNQVSHELKTPLTNIRLYAEMAQQRAEELNDEAVSRHLSVVEAETSRLSRLIHNVLTFARQQRDQLTIHRRHASLDDVTTRVVGMWRPLLEAKGFNVKCELGADRPFHFDPDAVEQILGNLLSNIEKYADGGRFARVATEIQADAARLTVEDRGPGIPSKMRDAVFAPFVRVRSDVGEGVSGTGIGLSIARSLAELHGGTLVFEEVSEGGSRFVLTLPFKIS